MNKPTMEDVAAKAGVSRALVSLVMNDSPKVSNAKRLDVLAAADALGYRPNLNARNLAQQRTRIIGVLVDDLHNPFFNEVLDGIDVAAAEHDLRILILNGGRDLDRETRATETFLQLRVEGLVLVGSLLDDHRLASTAAEVPAVIVASGWRHPGVDTLTADDAVGAALAVEHLHGLGHHDIVHIDGGGNISAEPRRNGYAAAMRARGLEPRIVIGGDSEAAAADALKRIIDTGEPPTAIFAFNDLLAAGLLDALDDRGLRVPDDISLIGYDNTFIAGLHHLSLTTINQPRAQFGRLAIETLLERIEGGRTEPTIQQLEPSLVVRKTTAAPTAPEEL